MNDLDLTEGLKADYLEEQGDIEAADAIRYNPWKIGESYYFRLATYAWVGRVVSVGPNEICLEDAAFVADSGRFSSAMKKGLLQESQSEIEPVGEAILGRGALVDSCPYRHELPTQVK